MTYTRREYTHKERLEMCVHFCNSQTLHTRLNGSRGRFVVTWIPNTEMETLAQDAADPEIAVAIQKACALTKPLPFDPNLAWDA